MPASHYLEGCFAFVAAFLGIVNLRGWLVTRYRTSHGGCVLGHAVGTKVKQGITGPPSYTFWQTHHAIVRYTDQHGRSHTTLAGSVLPVGAQVAVVYNPRHPGKAEEPSTDMDLRTGASCIAVALALVIVILVT
jgi:hypothetical protein